MTWYAVYELASGALRSLTTVEPNPLTLPAGLAHKSLSKGDDGTVLWDEVGRDWKNRPPPPPPVDRVQDLVVDPSLAAVWDRLTTTQRTVLRDRLARLLGPFRFRGQSQPVDLD